MQLWRVEVMPAREQYPTRRYLKVEAETGKDALEVARRHLGDYSSSNLRITDGCSAYDSRGSTEDYSYIAHAYDELPVTGRVVS